MNLLAGWRRQVADRTNSPWPGPRPMRAGRDDRSALVGRDDDLDTIVQLIKDTPVVVLTGASGVGKTSVLQLGLLRTLKGAGYTVLVCDDWNRSSEVPSVDSLIYREAADQLSPLARLSLGDGRGLLDTFEELYSDHAVIILDQFEELIRYQRKEYQKVLRWIERAASKTNVHIVISLRVEYEYELNGPSGLKVGPFDRIDYPLPPITDRRWIKEIIDGGTRDPEVPAINDDSRNLLLDAWESAAGPDAASERGLLHLQALLFVLWMTKAKDLPTIALSAGPEGDDAGDEGDDAGDELTHALARLASVGEENESTWTDSDASDLFSRALARAVHVLLGECREACSPSKDGSWPGLDPVLSVRALALAQSMSGFLSSGGYKVSQAREDLASFAIFSQGASALEQYAPNVKAAGKKLADLVDSSAPSALDDDTEVFDWLSESRADLGLEPPTGWPWEMDPRDVAGGVLLGLRPEDSLIEEFRSFYFALEWLRICELVRITTPFRGKTMVTLIHDLFGGGLVEWSRSVTQGADVAVHQFAAIRGVELEWKKNLASSTISEPVVANLRWRTCDVRADFEQVTFVNCDFRGTRFLGSSFRGASFVNCMLDDVEFLECTIIGSPSSETESSEQPDRPPSFFIRYAPPSLLSSLQWYREPRRQGEDSQQSDEEIGLYSQTAGIAAVPANCSIDKRVMLLEPQTEGLSMFGGRISSLKVRACTFQAGGRLALRHVAGTSIEFADQMQARVDIQGAAIRGLTITRPIDPDDEKWADQLIEQPDPRFELNFNHSKIINAWFGVGLSGTATFDDCLMLQVFNAADRDAFKVVTKESSPYGVVNVEPFEPDDPKNVKPPTAESLGDLRTLVREASSAIDYRERPLPEELGLWLGDVD